MNRLLFFVVAAVIFPHPFLNAATSAITTTPASLIRAHSTATQLRDFAFARCMALSFDDIEVVSTDANAASMAYAVSAQMNGADVNAIDGFVKEWLKEPYLSKRGGDLKIMRCIDFQQSSDMAVLPALSPVRTYDESTQLLRNV